MPYLIHIAILICIYSILALSLDLVVGVTGLVSVTQAAFYGVGAYATTLLMLNMHLNFFLAAALGMVITGFFALLSGMVFSRFKGEFYSLGSFGFNIIVFSILLNWQDLTRGPLGIPGITRPDLFGFIFSDNLSFLVLAVVCVMLTFAIYSYIVGSSFGRVLRSIREDEEAISVFGYSTPYFKLIVFVISAMLAALAGALFASYISYIDPTSFNLPESIFILAIIILGGLASGRGALLGAFLLIILPEALRFVGFPSDIAAQMRQVVYGLLLIGMMLYRPQGLLGTFRL